MVTRALFHGAKRSDRSGEPYHALLLWPARCESLTCARSDNLVLPDASARIRRLSTQNKKDLIDQTLLFCLTPLFSPRLGDTGCHRIHTAIRGLKLSGILGRRSRPLEVNTHHTRGLMQPCENRRDPRTCYIQNDTNRYFPNNSLPNSVPFENWTVAHERESSIFRCHSM